MATVTVPAEQRLVLFDISWPQYLGYSNMLGEMHVRVTYDGHRMELMTLSPEHERAKKLLDRLLAVLAEELNISIASFGSMTCRREDIERGLEPDECYWIANEPSVRWRTDIDLDNDPPPDLVVEVEISRSALNRMGLYAGLRVPEVWRWDGQTLRVCLLEKGGAYSEGGPSQAFPFLPMNEVERFLRDSAEMTEVELMRTFRKWVRRQVSRGWKPASPKKGKKKRP